MTGGAGLGHHGHVGGTSSLPEELLRELPEIYATVLRLRAQGVDDRLLAETVKVSPDAVHLLVEVAERKLRRLSAVSRATSDG